jgi:hypothetical protein
LNNTLSGLSLAQANKENSLESVKEASMTQTVWDVCFSCGIIRGGWGDLLRFGGIFVPAVFPR